VEILQIAGIAVCGVLTIAVMKVVKPEFTIYVTLGTVIIILVFSMDQLTAVFQFLKTVYDDMTYGKDFFPILIKVLAVAYLTDFTAQLCRDAGENSIGNKVEMAGKIIIFYISLPILVSVLQLVNSIL